MEKSGERFGQLKHNVYNGEAAWTTSEQIDNWTDYTFVKPVLYVKSEDVANLVSYHFNLGNL